jgi:hypothetical protein
MPVFVELEKSYKLLSVQAHVTPLWSFSVYDKYDTFDGWDDSKGAWGKSSLGTEVLRAGSVMVNGRLYGKVDSHDKRMSKLTQ